MIHLISKKGVGDFFVFLIIVPLIIFMLILMNGVALVLVAPKEEVPESFREYYTKELVRFLRTPADFISVEYNGLNLAEYIYIGFSKNDFSGEFEKHALSYLDSVCSYYHGREDRCQFVFEDVNCLMSSRTHTICRKQIPNLLGGKQVTSLTFQAPNGNKYNIILNVH